MVSNTLYQGKPKQMPYVTSIERMAKEEGRQEGLREGILESIELGLSQKFEEDGLQLLPEISKISDLEVLKAVQASLWQAKTLDELRPIYQSHRK